MYVLIDQFPGDLIINLWSEWTDFPDLVVVDSALCSKAFRSSFLELISSENFVHSTKSLYKKGNYFSWLIEKNVKIKYFDLSAYFSENVQLPFEFFEYFKKIRVVELVVMGDSENLVTLVTKHNVKGLDLSNSGEMKDARLKEYLLNCPNLTGLKLNDCVSLTNESCENIANCCPKLTSFECKGVENITFEGYVNLSDGCQNLSCLTIAAINDYDLDDSVIANIVQDCPKLTHFSIANCGGELTNESMFHIAEYCPLLEHLNIRECSEINDLGVVRVLTSCKLLNSIDLSGISSISNDALNAFMHCPLLHTIKLADCDIISDDGMIALITACPLLKCVDLYGCLRLTDLTILALIEHSKYLSEVDIGDTIFTDFAISELIDKCDTLISLSCELTEGLILRAMRGVKSVIFNDDPSVPSRTLKWDRSITRNKSHTIITYFSCDNIEFMSSLPTLAVIAPDLECVSFLNYLQVDQEILCKFFKMCGNLHSVCIKGMQNLVRDTITDLATFNKNLRNLTLTHCTSLDHLTIPIVADLLRETLERVDFSYNSKSFYVTSSNMFEYMLKSCIKLRHVRIVTEHPMFHDVVAMREKYPGVGFQFERYVGEEDGVVQNE